MLDSVKEFRQVHVHAPAVAAANRALDLLGGSVCGTPVPKTETRFGERWIEDRGQDLQDGLLNQAIDHVGNAEVSLAAIGFGNRLPPARARTVSPFQELLPNDRPMVPEGLEELVQGDAVGAGGTAVRFDLFPSTLDVRFVNNRFDQ